MGWDGMGDALIIGRAYGRRATLEVAGDALTWRARKGQLEQVAENIATTTQDVRDVRWLERRFSLAGAALAGLSVMWMASETVWVGLVTLAIAAGLIAFRAARPKRHLALELGGRWLVLHVDRTSAADARALAARIERRLLTGELLDKPLALP